MRNYFLWFLLTCAVRSSLAQDSTVYQLNPWVDVPLIAGSGAATFFALQREADERPLSIDEVLSLNQEDVFAWDRCAFRIDPTKQGDALVLSDIVLNVSAVAPVLLMIDKRVRSEWLTVATLYVEAATVTAGMQTWTSALVGRRRPIAYLGTATIEQRVDARNSHSFYSGHTSNTAVGAFFIAKVLDDMHPELGRRKWWLYGGALIPVGLVGWSRIQGGKHFPTDILMGALMGGATGFLVPELHKRSRKNGLSLMPILNEELLGMSFSVRW